MPNNARTGLLALTIQDNDIFTVGITGGIGSGKTQVCRHLEACGMPVLFADTISKSISETNPWIRAAIIHLLGSGAYHPDGQLNRQFVAGRIFADAQLKRKLEDILHPAVEEDLGRRLRHLAAGGSLLAGVEAALIFESGLNRSLDCVIVVDADESVRIRRIRQRDGSDLASVRARIAAQMPPEEKVRQADFVILNNGSRKDLERRVRFIYSLLTTMARGVEPS